MVYAWDIEWDYGCQIGEKNRDCEGDPHHYLTEIGFSGSRRDKRRSTQLCGGLCRGAFGNLSVLRVGSMKHES